MERLPGFIWRCRQKLGFCFHGDLEFQFYCCCVSPACSKKKGGLGGGKGAGNSVTFLIKALELQQGRSDGDFGTLRPVLLHHRSGHCISDNSLARSTRWSAGSLCRIRIQKMMGRVRNGLEETQEERFLQEGGRKRWGDTFRWEMLGDRRAAWGRGKISLWKLRR